METQSYTSFIDFRPNDGMNYCSKASSERPLIVNSSGHFKTSVKFTTFNPTGRLDYYLLCIESGELAVTFPDGEKSLGSGTVLLIPPGTPYKYALKSENQMGYFWLHFTGSHAESTLSDYGLKIFPEYNFMEIDNGVVTRFQNIFEAFSKKDRFRDRELSVLLDRLLISLARRLEKNRDDGRTLTKSIGYINSKYNTKIEISFLAKMENISISRYNTVFRHITGISPVEYITNLRIAAAAELLTNTDLTVKEIGIMVGYSDPHFFSKIFKSRLGVSPRFYRKGENT